MNKHGNLTVTLFSACVLSLSIAGCERSEAPAKTQADVTNAQAEGAKDIAQKRHDAAESAMDAQKDVNKANAELAHKSSEGDRSVTVAEAEAMHKVSIERCEALTGSARTDCKKQADIDLDRAKMRADTNEHMSDPKR